MATHRASQVVFSANTAFGGKKEAKTVIANKALSNIRIGISNSANSMFELQMEDLTSGSSKRSSNDGRFKCNS